MMPPSAPVRIPAARRPVPIRRNILRDEPGAIAGEREDKSVGQVEQAEARPGDRNADRQRSVDAGEHDGVADDKPEIHRVIPLRLVWNTNAAEASPLSLPACMPMMRSTRPSSSATFCSAMTIAESPSSTLIKRFDHALADLRGEAERRLVDEKQRSIGHEASADRDHAPFAARQPADRNAINCSAAEISSGCAVCVPPARATPAAVNAPESRCSSTVRPWKISSPCGMSASPRARSHGCSVPGPGCACVRLRCRSV